MNAYRGNKSTQVFDGLESARLSIPASGATSIEVWENGRTVEFVADPNGTDLATYDGRRWTREDATGIPPDGAILWPSGMPLASGWEQVGTVSGFLIIQRGTPSSGVAPTITTQATISGGTSIDDILTLDPGAATGTPTPSAVYQWYRDGAALSGETGLTVNTGDHGAGVYSATVVWTNGVLPAATSTSGNITVEDTAAPSIDYSQALVSITADTPYTGTASAVTAVQAGGTGGFTLSVTGTGAAIQRTADGFIFTDGVYLQTGILSGQPTTDGLFAVVDITLNAYGSNTGQILEGAGGHVKLRDNSGNLQTLGQDDSAVTLALGSVTYGQRMIFAGQIDDVADMVAGITTAGGDVSAAHGGLTDPALTRVITGRYINGTLHRMAIFARPEGGSFPFTMREVFEDFQLGA